MVVSATSSSDASRTLKERGYVWLRDFWTPEEAAAIKIVAEAMEQQGNAIIARGTGPSLKEVIVVREAKNPKLACRVEDILTCYPEFQRIMDSRVTPLLHDMMGEEYTFFKDKLNFKWPGGGAFVAHQDYPAYAMLPPRSHINVMVSVDQATLENGALYVAKNWRQDIPNLPEVPVLPYVEGGSNHGAIKPEITKLLQWLPLEVSPRDLVLFDSFVPHYSEPNGSQHSRRAFFVTYNKLSEGEHRTEYYRLKREDPSNPMFHFGTPTMARGKDEPSSMMM